MERQPAPALTALRRGVRTALGRGGERLAAASRRIVAVARRHPVLISAPLAALAVGAGFGAQALLRPAGPPAEADLLEALIAQPQTGSRPSEGPGLPAGADGLAAPAVRAQRPSTSSGDQALMEPEAGPEVPLEIRVALLRASASPQLAASGPWQLVDRDGRVLQQGGAGTAVDTAGALASRAEVWLETGAGDHLLVDGQAYEGRLRVLRSANGLQVINHLPLERYISSVVGAEMPSGWNMEALRAQAVAARSYAMAHMARPASAHWHLGDTTRWQAYRGLDSVNARTRQATASTAGVILSYQGGIVESLYAATSRISQEAHGHLGASMSQHGAQDLAEQGLRYNEILGRYYQGASLARLQAGAS